MTRSRCVEESRSSAPVNKGAASPNTFLEGKTSTMIDRTIIQNNDDVIKRGLGSTADGKIERKTKSPTQQRNIKTPGPSGSNPLIVETPRTKETIQELRVIKCCTRDSDDSDSSALGEASSASSEQSQSSPCHGERGRRAIFGQYWNRVGNPSESVDGQRVTSSRISVPQRRSSFPEVDISEFSPPENHRPSLSERFSSIDDFLADASTSGNHLLPTVPSPLRRYCSDLLHPGGVYPLVSPRSILKPSGHSSPKRSKEPLTTRLDNTGSLEIKSDKTGANGKNRGSDFPKNSRKNLPWAFTASPGIKPRKKLSMTRETIPPIIHEAEENSKGRQVVQFDPRVTITEFEEPSGRQWFSDAELNSFKREASVLAHRYMLLHPRAARAFNEGRRDPITGRVRERAMFTNPALSANGSISPGAENIVEVKDLIEEEIRQVLIVDPNEPVRKLFSKSIQKIFPQVCISSAENGEDALREFTDGLSRQQPFDIIVVEERLGRRQHRTSEKLKYENHRVQSVGSFLNTKETCTQASDDSVMTFMSGSDVLRELSRLQTESVGTVGSDPCDSPNVAGATRPHRLAAHEPTPSSMLSRVALLIGVSLHLDEDGSKLTASGADIVWGKPPPRMDNNLRNEIFSALLDKRHGSSLSATFHTDRS